jgi:UDP-glucose 4-epimerase
MSKIKTKYNTALVTGGAGFIGSHLVARLLHEGLRVVSLDDYSSGKDDNLAHLEDNTNLSIEKCDVTDYEKLEKIFAKYQFDVVFHNAASKKNICLKDPKRDLEVNGAGTYNILHLSREHGVKKVVHASTGSVYGEAQYFPQDESHPLVPLSFYGVSKLAGEKYCKMFSEVFGLDTTVLRYFHVYGPNQESDDDLGGVVAIFKKRVSKGLPLIIHGDGTQQRSFTHVDDVVGINLFVAETEGTKGEAYNCASGVNVTINELAQAFRNRYNQDIKILHDEWLTGDIKVFDVDNSKLTDMGFEFNISFTDGLADLLDLPDAS